jgi:CubicO group peptidase (beta-lactamase class C family)
MRRLLGFTVSISFAMYIVPMQAQAGDRNVFPGKEWKTDSPDAHGLSLEKLHAAAGFVKKVEERYGFLVVKDGVIVYETYFSGDEDSIYPAFSVAKGFGAALIGVAQTQGLLHTKDKVQDWLPIHHPDIKEGATIEHIMSMTAGHDPLGATYQYTSGPILNSLPNIIQLASGMAPYDFYKKELAKPIGLSIDWPHLDKGWLQIGTQRVQGLPPLPSNHRDLARLGLLWLNKGKWKGKQIIAEEFIEASLKPPFPNANNAYGYLWWLNTDGGTWRTPYRTSGEGKIIPDAPSNMYYAAGARSQLIFVVPDHNLVVVTMGNTERGGTPTHDIWDAILSFLPAE